MTDNYVYIRCHMPSGRLFEARIPSLLSSKDADWLLVLVSLLDTNLHKLQQEEVKPGND